MKRCSAMWQITGMPVASRTAAGKAAPLRISRGVVFAAQMGVVHKTGARQTRGLFNAPQVAHRRFRRADFGTGWR